MVKVNSRNFHTSHSGGVFSGSVRNDKIESFISRENKIELIKLSELIKLIKLIQ